MTRWNDVAITVFAMETHNQFALKAVVVLVCTLVLRGNTLHYGEFASVHGLFHCSVLENRQQ